MHSDIDEAGRYFQVRDLLHEIYSAMAAEHFRLAAMGVRALIEFVIVDRVGDNGTFEKNLTALHDAGYISERQKEMVKTALDVGSAAIHRNHEPSEEDVNFGLSIGETLLQTVYVQEPQSVDVGKRVPKRQRSKRGNAREARSRTK